MELNEILEDLKKEGININEDLLLFIIGVAFGLIQIVKRGDKYFFRITPINNLPEEISWDLLPENVKKYYQSLKEYFKTHREKIGKQSIRQAVKHYEEKYGRVDRESFKLTEQQKQKLLERLRLFLK